MNRLSVSAWAMEIAVATAQRSTCLRRHVGCVLLNRRNHVLSTGYNGVASGQPHCNEAAPLPPPPGCAEDIGERRHFPHACPGHDAPPGATGTKDECQAIHAEQNALLQCRDVYDINSCYVTLSPCFSCVKLLLNTSCKHIVFLEEYPDHRAKERWLKDAPRTGRTWSRL